MFYKTEIESIKQNHTSYETEIENTKINIFFMRLK